MTVTVACCACAQPTMFPVLVHRDGYSVEPKVAICPSCDALPRQLLWTKIAQPSPHPCAFKPLHLSFTRPEIAGGKAPIVVHP